MWEIFRVILDAFDDEERVIVDYSALYDGGWCDAIPEKELLDMPKTIILTEGKYDAYVISESLKLLYPYMSKFYSFMDFSSFNVQGSTNFLTHYLKAFIGAGIENRIIAIYDNDAAGLNEIETIKTMELPNNVRVMHLPNLDIAKNYPTVGPTGDENIDINGKACSIEMFLGDDIIKENNMFIPIKWNGYIEKIGCYQGEIIKKSLIQKKFENKLKKAKEFGINNVEEWKELELLLNTIFEVFV